MYSMISCICGASRSGCSCSICTSPVQTALRTSVDGSCARAKSPCRYLHSRPGSVAVACEYMNREGYAQHCRHNNWLQVKPGLYGGQLLNKCAALHAVAGAGHPADEQRQVQHFFLLQGPHVSRCPATACGMPPASRFMMDTARHLQSSCGLLNRFSRCGTSTVLGLSAVPGTSLSSCTGVSSAICTGS